MLDQVCGCPPILQPDSRMLDKHLWNATDPVRASFAKTGLEVVPTVAPPAEFARFVAASNASWGKTVREAKIQVDLK
jgi:hypothetical protein